MTESTPGKVKRKWIYHPNIDVQMAPFYHWPPKIGPALGYIVGTWSPLGIRFHHLILALITWFYLTPALERCREFNWDWMAQIWARNLVLVLIVGGALHLDLYTYNKQGDTSKYDPRDLSRDSKLFKFNNQVWDNMFYVLASAVTVWTLYEVIMLWAYANGYAPMMTFSENPIWFILVLFLIPWWAGFHFYVQHRIMHFPWLYRHVHRVHHRNSNTGPWSGSSMHPVEHLVWLSDVFIFLFVLSHPIHVIFILQFHSLGAIITHSGYENLHVGKTVRFRIGDFFHQQHHRYCDCNYGSYETPWDKWFSTFHDGTPEGDDMVKQLRRELLAKQAN